MPVSTLNFTTGPSTLPDVGTLSYNGCTFSPLFQSNMSGTVVKDAAGRTTKLMEFVLEVEGYVTAPSVVGVAGPNPTTGISATMANLALLLTAQAAPLVYNGRGFDFSVDAAGAATFNKAARDVVWGPVPDLLEFQPLGAGMSAKIKWRVTVRVVLVSSTKGPTSGAKFAPIQPLLQFNCETTVGYGEDYYSTLSIRGTMEIPLTRLTQTTRTLSSTVDDARTQLDARIFSGIDLSRFKVTRRDYSISRDKRTMEFDVSVEEKAYMDLPPDCTMAGGTFSVKPSKAGMGLANWQCTLRATYTVASGRPRRVAWFAFLLLLRDRINYSVLASDSTGKVPLNTVVQTLNFEVNKRWTPPSYNDPIDFWVGALNTQNRKLVDRSILSAWLIDFSFDEGLYSDSKTVSFSATWKLVTSFDTILIASGLWMKMKSADAQGNNVWAASVANISGSTSWLTNPIDPKLDVIVDFGGG